MKVIDKIRAAAAAGDSNANGNGGDSCSNNKVVFSFEFFPPKTDDGVDNLFERMDRMVSHNPSFCDITWGAGGSTADLTLDIANKMQNIICVETMMHLTCTNMPVEKIDHALETIKSNGIQNVLALRGDPPHGQDKFVQIQGGLACALDLVKHIRSKHGDYFGITVAGYPEAHPDVIGSDGFATPEDYHKDLAYLKQKVDAGADLIVTQLFYDTDIFLKFVNDCRQIGITCPIVPGIMPINNYKGFIRMTGFCKTKVPAEVTAALEPIKDNEEAVRAYGIHLGTEMCKKILAHGIKTLHLYTLNMEKSALAILMNLGLIEESKITRPLPWRPPTNVFRVKEDVRPIFWANRPKSYLTRTIGWDQYPHGRWGDSRNPSYGALSDYQFMRPRARGKKLLEEWAAPLKSVEDIYEKFKVYCLGKLKSSPWSELDGLQAETKIINEQLGKINLKGFKRHSAKPKQTNKQILIIANPAMEDNTAASNLDLNDTNNAALIDGFCEITSSSKQEALFFLESHQWDLDSAISTFMDSDSDPPLVTAIPPLPSHPVNSPSPPPPQSHSPSQSPSRSRSPSRAPNRLRSRDKKPSANRTRGGVRTLADLNRIHDGGSGSDDDDDEPQQYYAGGEKSGMLVQDPTKRHNVDAIFDQARNSGATADYLQPSSSSRSFPGTGRLLSGDTTVPPAPQPPAAVNHTVTLWRNGFTVDDDGPLRRFDDPANASFLESIKQSECPKELEPADRRAQVHLNLMRREENYSEPEKPQVPFQGVGRALGSTSTPTGPAASEPAVAVAPLKAAPHPTPDLVIDSSSPTTLIQLRLADGTRMVPRFNLNHNIRDIRAFIEASRPGEASNYQLQIMGFPPKLLTDLDQTIEEAGMASSVVIQKF